MEYRNEQGQLHRLDGPALIIPNSCKAWCINGKLHRLDGPAVEYASGRRTFWIADKNYTEAQYQKRISEMIQQETRKLTL